LLPSRRRRCRPPRPKRCRLKHFLSQWEKLCAVGAQFFPLANFESDRQPVCRRLSNPGGVAGEVFAAIPIDFFYFSYTIE
jgi:hypothetical protein